MKHISEIHDEDIGLLTRDVKYTIRTAARAVLRNKGKIALLHVSKHHYYKIPGGGIEKGESIKEGLQREVAEETGCTFTVEEDIGEIVEYKSYDKEVQTSYCFLADVINEGKQNFTKME